MRDWISQLTVTKSAPLGGCDPYQCLWLSTPGQEAEEVLSGVLKITQHGIVKRSYLFFMSILHFLSKGWLFPVHHSNKPIFGVLPELSSFWNFLLLFLRGLSYIFVCNIFSFQPFFKTYRPIFGIYSLNVILLEVQYLSHCFIKLRNISHYLQNNIIKSQKHKIQFVQKKQNKLLFLKRIVHN